MGTIIDELNLFEKNKLNFSDLTAELKDTLYGSMMGLNLRYQTLEESLKSNKEAIVKGTRDQLEHLIRLKKVEIPYSGPLPRQEIGFGTYGWKYDRTIIEKALKLNVGLIDTAEGYGFGKVETELGKIFKEIEPRPSNITTKVSRNHMSPSALVSAANRSVEKLGVTPHYQLHFPNLSYSDIQLGKALVQLRKAGKIKSIGLGNCSVAMIESMNNFLQTYSKDKVHSVQVSYSLIDRRIESFLLPYCQQRGILVIAYSPLGQKFKDLNRPILPVIAKKYGATPAQIALAWILSKPGVLPIPRTNNIEHLIENSESNELILEKDDIKILEEYYCDK